MRISQTSISSTIATIPTHLPVYKQVPPPAPPPKKKVFAPVRMVLICIKTITIYFFRREGLALLTDPCDSVCSVSLNVPQSFTCVDLVIQT